VARKKARSGLASGMKLLHGGKLCAKVYISYMEDILIIATTKIEVVFKKRLFEHKYCSTIEKTLILFVIY